ncbi:MAG: glucose-1-phosphate adenylyltransferase [Treponema sp.]|nr:glucose-1-phosphate adenylyltransferase [Treponema sp.]
MAKDKKKIRVVSLILGGGKGTRLYPLTKERSKPAVSFGGKYRLVDIPISNCINSGFKKIYLLTQYNSTSLHHHITNSYNFDRFSSGFVEILAAEQTLENDSFHQGTADSVRKSFQHFAVQNPTHYLILSGDQLYHMDLKAFLDHHIKTGAEVSVAATTVTREEASRYGLMKINNAGRIQEFKEKPSIDLDLTDWKIPKSLRETNVEDINQKEYLASMGIYIFNAKTLEELLNGNDSKDFGKEIIPNAVKTHQIFSYIFDGYWEDIGTIKSFYEANIKLTHIDPEFNFYDEEEPIYTHPRNLPPSKINKAIIKSTLTSEGCIITDANLTHSVIGLRSVIENGTVLDHVVMMGADFYETKDEKNENLEQGVPNLGIGRNCNIRKTIIDKNAHIGDNVRINVDGNEYEDGDHGKFYSADGIIVIRKGAYIPSGTVI